MNKFHPRGTAAVPSTIPPALRHAIRDDIIDPQTARRLAPYLPNSHHQARPEDRVDAAARLIGKILLLTGFTVGVLTGLTALVALGAWLFRTITG
jgi:hypothetical protein